MNPLGLNQPNSYARRYLLSQMSRGELFRLHLLGNVFRQYLPSLLIGNYAWSAFIAPDMDLDANEVLEFLKAFTEPGHIQHVGGSSSG